MANLLSAENLSKSYGDKQLFEGLYFGLAEGQKVALIGINGSGKSTLMKILAGVESADTGQVSCRKGMRMAWLPQEPILPGDLTIADLLLSEQAPTRKLILDYERLLTIAHPDARQHREMERLADEIQVHDAWNYENRVNETLGKLGIYLPDQRIATLSGGQVRRLALAKALLDDPELLILDEPTNHLDIESIEWLEQFLSTARQSLLVVTHDRYFLNSISNEIIELDQGRIFPYKGDYQYFLGKKAERLERDQQSTDKARGLYRHELEWLRRSPKARGTKSKSRIDAAHTLGELASRRHDQAEVKLQVKGRRIGGKVLEIKNIRKAYGDLKLVDDFSYTFSRRDRIGVTGPNGVGKTTFIQMLLGEEPQDSGKIRPGETIVFGHYTQGGLKFKDNARIIEVVREAAESVELSKSQTLSADQLLEHFLFPRKMHSRMVSTLSGGEKRRLHLLRVLMTNPNFLVLDEPTNDLDLETLRRLEEFLVDFEGCLMVISHDRFFMDRLVDHLFVFEGEGKITDFPGSYSQFRRWQSEQAIRTEKPKTPEKESVKKSQAKKLSYKEKRELEQLERDIAALESEKERLAKSLSDPTADYAKLNEWGQALEKIREQLEEKEMRWLELSEKMDA